MIGEALGSITMLAIIFVPIAVASRREIAEWCRGFKRSIS